MNATHALLVIFAASALGETPSERKSLSDKPIASFKLRDYRGTRHSLDDGEDKKLAFVAFLGTECPLAKRYAGRVLSIGNKR